MKLSVVRVLQLRDGSYRAELRLGKAKTITKKINSSAIFLLGFKDKQIIRIPPDSIGIRCKKGVRRKVKGERKKDRIACIMHLAPYAFHLAPWSSWFTVHGSQFTVMKNVFYSLAPHTLPLTPCLYHNI
jgi:hypothetical protein